METLPCTTILSLLIERGTEGFCGSDDVGGDDVGVDDRGASTLAATVIAGLSAEL